MKSLSRRTLRDDLLSTLALTSELVRIRSTVGSSRGAVQVLHAVANWLDSNGLPSRILTFRGAPIALATEVASDSPGPTLCLNACVDTAPIGAAEGWRVPPLSGEVLDGWLHGRGSADSKVGVAMFCHVIRYWARRRLPAGRLVVCFDGDEHTGRFHGVRTFHSEFPTIDAVMIGYPGQDVIKTGARGFWRASVTVYGVGQHSASRRTPRNAIVKASELVRALTQISAEGAHNSMGPQVTVTGIRGGNGFTTVPDSCVLQVDVRLTPQFDSKWAESAVGAVIAAVDDRFPYERPSLVRRRQGWPAYQLSEDAPVVVALRGAAEDVLGRQVLPEAASPSNTGNYFAARGVPATCGFGVAYRNIHAPNEAFEVASLVPAIETYLLASERFVRSSIDELRGPQANWG